MSGRRSRALTGVRPGGLREELAPPSEESKFGGRSAGQDRDRVFELGSGDSQIGQLRPSALQLRLRERDVGHRHDTALKAIPSELQVLLVRTDSFLEQPPIGVETLTWK